MSAGALSGEDESEVVGPGYRFLDTKSRMTSKAKKGGPKTPTQAEYDDLALTTPPARLRCVDKAQF